MPLVRPSPQHSRRYVRTVRLLCTDTQVIASYHFFSRTTDSIASNVRTHQALRRSKSTRTPFPHRQPYEPDTPLLARENFVGSIDYDAMVPVLRLLTRLLNTPQVRHYLFVTFFGWNEKASIQDNHGRDLEAYTSDRSSITDLSHSDIAAVGQKSRGMAKVVNFEVSARYKHEKNRWCVPVDSTPECDVPRVRSNANKFQGVHSTIFIAKFWYDAITDPNNKHIIGDRFSVTLILLHELGHEPTTP